jgi:hypothetical protein
VALRLPGLRSNRRPGKAKPPPGKTALLILYQQRFQQVQIVQQLLQRLVADLARGAQVIQFGTL